MQQTTASTDGVRDAAEYRRSSLLCRAKQGERAAFDALQVELLPAVARFVRRLIGNDESADDIVRESFLALYLNLGRMDRPGALLPFLYRVARNRSYDVLRRQGRFETVPLLDGDGADEEGAASLAGYVPRPEDVVARMQAWSHLQAAIDRLPELQRQTLILFSEGDMSYAEVAEVMATDIGTVRSRLFNARRGLLRRLRPDTLEALGVFPDTPKGL